MAGGVFGGSHSPGLSWVGPRLGPVALLIALLISAPARSDQTDIFLRPGDTIALYGRAYEVKAEDAEVVRAELRKHLDESGQGEATINSCEVLKLTNTDSTVADAALAGICHFWGSSGNEDMEICIHSSGRVEMAYSRPGTATWQDWIWMARDCMLGWADDRD